MKPRNPTPSGNPAKPTAPAGSDTSSTADNDRDAAAENPDEEVNGTTEQAQMEFQNAERPSGPIRLRPPTRPGGLAGSRMSTGSDAEQPSKQYQRTIDELNRRIIALEGTQRERAQELAKEKEVRLKTERQLAAAERALQESAQIIENTRVEAKRELDTEIRKRDSETGRQTKDTQKAVVDLQEEVRRLQEELEKARANAPERSTDASGDAGAWEARALAQFEEDIDNYRARIKSLIQERDSLSKEKDRLAEALANGGATAGGQADDSELRGELEELRSRNAKLAEHIEALEAEAKNTRSPADAAVSDVEVSKLAAELERAANERDLAQAEAEKLMTELDGLRDLRRQDQEKFDRERAANQFNKESGAVSLRKTIDVQQKAIASITKERDEVNRLHESLGAELTEAVNARLQLLQEVEALRGETQSIRDEAIRSTEELRSEHEAALLRLKEEHAQVLADASRRYNEVEGDRADLLQQLSAASGRIADLEGRLADAERALRETGDALAKQEQSLSQIAADSDRTIQSLQEKHAEELVALRAEKEQLDVEAREYISKLREEHAAEVAALSRSEGEVIAQKNRDIEQLRAELESLQQRAARELAEMERAAEQNLNASRMQINQQLAERDRQMTEILNALAEARDGRQQDNASFSGEFRALMKQRDDAVAEVQRMRNEVDRQAEGIQEFKNDATKSSDELRARAEREILRLQREREQLIKQRDEFRNRVKQLADQQRRLLEEVANDPFRSLGSHRLPEPAPVFIEPISTKHNAPADSAEWSDEGAQQATGDTSETILERPERSPKPEPAKPNIPLPRARPAAPPPPQVRRAE